MRRPMAALADDRQGEPVIKGVLLPILQVLSTVGVFLQMKLCK